MFHPEMVEEAVRLGKEYLESRSMSSRLLFLDCRGELFRYGLDREEVTALLLVAGLSLEELDNILALPSDPVCVLPQQVSLQPGLSTA